MAEININGTRNKEKKREYDKKYREENQGKYNEQRRKQYECNKEKRLAQCSEWYKNNRERVLVYHKDWYAKNKKHCNEKSREWKENNEGKYKEHRQNAKEKKYNLTSEQMDEMLIHQGNCCAICKERFTKTPCIDHDHNTDKVRGLLCNNCNFALGHTKDNITILKNAIEYLERHNGNQY